MNVTDSNVITNTIETLRKTVYSNPEFKKIFLEKLHDIFDISQIVDLPDQFGGWIINLNINDQLVGDSSQYVSMISNILSETLSNLHYNNIAFHYCLINVISTGNNSLTIKL